MKSEISILILKIYHQRYLKEASIKDPQKYIFKVYLFINGITGMNFSKDFSILESLFFRFLFDTLHFNYFIIIIIKIFKYFTKYCNIFFKSFPNETFVCALCYYFKHDFKYFE